MKVSHRTIPLDQLSVRSGKKHILIITHRHTVIVSAQDDLDHTAYHEFTFDELYNIVTGLKGNRVEEKVVGRE